jgi:hypothetical protein
MPTTIPYPPEAKLLPLYWSGGRFTPEHDMRAVLWLLRGQEGAILEIGTAEGVSTLEMANHFPSRIIYTADCPWAHVPKEQGSERPDYERFALNCRSLPNVAPIMKSAKTLRPDMFNNVQAVFIDGDHSYDGVARDTELAISILVKNGGVIIWHDYHTRAEWVGVKKFVDQSFPEAVHIEGTEVAYLEVK